MIEQALVYIYSAGPGRRFIGCGALVEGGYVATCRHVWRRATEQAAKAENDVTRAVEVEYPYGREDTAPVRTFVRSVDACEGKRNPPPDGLSAAKPIAAQMRRRGRGITVS